jgi:hypothetical protein
MERYMLTTVDNPYNPFTEFDEWYGYDITYGHNTLGFLARVVKSSHELSEPDQQLAIQQGIDEIVALNVTGLYRKVPAPKEEAKQDTG